MKKKIIALMGMAVISCALLMGCGSKAETPAAETTTEAESSDEETAKTRRNGGAWKRLIQKKLQL